MALVCSISGEAPEHAVVSPVSGHVFERRLIEKFISENGTDPISGGELASDQLIEIKTSSVVKPRPLTSTSIPSILKMLQDEWDACMLQGFTMRQQLQTARQELSHALYQHDAACRVIARLTKELTAAREALATLKPHAGVPMAAEVDHYAAEAGQGGDEPMEEAGMTDDVIRKLQDKATVLTAARKQRGKSVPEGLAKSDDVKSFKQTAVHTGIHSASIPGITALDIQASDTRMILTGGNDKTAAVFNKETEHVVAMFKGHSKRITSAIYHPTEAICLTGSVDNTVRVWSVEEQAARHVIKAHDGAVTGISLHATGDYVLSVSADTQWAFTDLRTGRVLCKVKDDKSPQPITCAQFHPDGLIFGAGSDDAMVKIWDLKEQSNVANFPGHQGAIKAISFSENGYYLATAAEDAVVKLWDLRKLKNFKTLTVSDERTAVINDLCFDQSGTYLAVAGTDVRVFLCKQWQELVQLTDHTEMATGVRFGDNGTFLASAGMDRSLRFYGLNDA
uniref:Pre-mRNA-processing factor 19 n=1 Tax=Plectus sambesii TaxID=2011161 RepID=A0A914VWA8_9BILA